MEEKRRDAGMLQASAAEPHSADPPTRRRPGGQKRKASALGVSSPPSLPSKRFTREKHLMSQNQIQNGPLTRGRQTPSVSDAVGSSLSAKVEEKASAAALEVFEAEEERKAIKAWKALEAATEAEYEAIRFRDRNAHVVPNHCGWFSWAKVHSLEERALSSFFNGKSETKTPEMYMEIRNWIMKKFHADPNCQIEVKDLEELEIGDLDARQEILEFLDYWGLINFHPLLPADATMVDADNDEVAKKDSLVEQLYKFETVQSCYPIAPKIRQTTPTLVSGLFSEPTVAEELVEPEGPSVEYHCNSCSADCSRTRYHCQKQADFDLCPECFKDRKFGSGMSSSDFILMEPAEIHGIAGGTWTDQETLLLLEALELYKENWNEIAEHVATKTKAQCILHFVQMPIEDSFLDSESGVNAVLKENVDATTVSDKSSNPKEEPEVKDNKGDPEEAQAQNSAAMEIVKQQDADTEKIEDPTKKEDDVDVKVGEDNSNPTTEAELKVLDEKQESCAIKALREAFETLGYSSTPENPLSFAEVGNPVMALAGFLARLAGSDVATASARNSLKSLKSESPGMQLALKHCFILEDPPDLLKETAASQCVGTGDDPDNLDKQKTQKVDGDSPTVDVKTDPPSEDASKAAVKTAPSEDASKAAKELDSAKQPCNLNVTDSELQKEQTSVPENPSRASEAKLPGEDSKEEDGSEAREKDVDMKDSVPCKSTSTDPVKPDSVETPSGTGDEDMASNSLPADNVDQKPSPSVAEDQHKNHAKADKESAEEKDDHKMDRIKHAAITALSAAAVKAKLLAEHEEEQIKELTVLLIEKQLHKLETKLALFNEIDNTTMRVREHIDRSRQRLYHERAQIIASRLGFPASSSSRAMAPQSMPPNTRIPMNFANLGPRPPPGMTQTQRSPLARPMGNPSFGGFVPSQSGQASR